MEHTDYKLYSKDEALKVIVESANLYKINLENKELLFIYKNKTNVEYYRVSFKKSNFFHFAGIKSKLKAVTFYNKACRHKISTHDFELIDKFTSSKKYNVLKLAMALPYNARMIGDYGNQGILIKADLGVGNYNYVVTMGKIGDISCYPKGVMLDDIRKTTYSPSPIIATLMKDLTAEFFNEITYKSKNISTERLHFPKDLMKIITDKALLQIKPNIDLSKKAEGGK
ncbi:MAG: PBECR4 domain-containing protein [Clostridiales bacterium]|nr:PBECR4 domain-containing protein [Clostridiales bacterium]